MSDERKRGALLGLAVGDALGTTFEFERLDQAPYPALADGPARDVVGGGPFGVAAGQVTDDTQLAVCLARSLAACGRLDVDEVAARYVAWMEHAFDIGNQTHAALQRVRGGEAASAAGLAVWRGSGRRAAGNGSLMRTAPLAVALGGGEALVEAAVAESMITHADPRCALACAAYDEAIAALIGGAAARAALDAARAALGPAAQIWKSNALAGAEDAAALDAARADLARDLDAALADEPGVYTPELHVHRTAGFVRVAFRIACWHLVHTRDWRAALVDVASRGGDADTNAAIAGALLGARDGEGAIPEAWRLRVLGAPAAKPPPWGDAHHPRHLLALVGA